MCRIENFKKLETHPWLRKSYSRLKKDDESFCIDFLTKNKTIDKNSIAKLIVRLFLDKPKPKAWKEIEELLICSL